MHKVVAILFTIFAFVQYNDPDYYIWVPAYLVVTILVTLFDTQRTVPKGFAIASYFYAIWMITYVPTVLEWIHEGLPSITGSMKAESPFIEFIREFFGLAICLVACRYYARLEKRMSVH